MRFALLGAPAPRVGLAFPRSSPFMASSVRLSLSPVEAARARRTPRGAGAIVKGAATRPGALAIGPTTRPSGLGLIVFIERPKIAGEARPGPSIVHEGGAIVAPARRDSPNDKGIASDGPLALRV